MTTAAVTNGMVALSARVEGIENRAAELQVGLTELESDIAQLPTEFADLKAEVEGYTPTGEFESGIQDKFNRMKNEFVAKGVKVTAAKDALA